MSVLLNRGKELIRINPSNPQRLEVSINSGRVWSLRFYGLSTVGTFIDLVDNGKEILATPTKDCSFQLTKDVVGRGGNN
jgi:hypothetical protein